MAGDWWIPILIVLIIAITAFILSYTAVRFGWYQKLEKPYLYYDNWVYSPIWYFVYGIVIFTWIRMITSPYHYRVVIHILYTLQLLFILGWIVTFFYYRNPKGSMVWLFIATVILIAIILLSLDDPLSLFLLMLYLFWLLYLLYMTWQLVLLNPR